MKRVVLAVGLAASVAAPAAAQWPGMPVWNSPKGGTGITISGDWGRPDSAAGKGNAFGARAALGIGTVTLTAGVASYKPGGSSSQTAAVGGQVDFRVIGGSLLPIAVNAQLGAGTSAKIGTSYPKTTTVTAAVGFSVPLPTPGISIEPYFSPGLRYHKLENPVTGASASQTKFGFVLGANLGFGLFGLHAAYDYQDSDTGDKKVFGLGAHVAIKVPLGMRCWFTSAIEATTFGARRSRRAPFVPRSHVSGQSLVLRASILALALAQNVGALTLDSRRLGVLVSLAGAAAVPDSGVPFRVTTHPVYLVAGLLPVSQ